MENRNIAPVVELPEVSTEALAEALTSAKTAEEKAALAEKVAKEVKTAAEALKKEVKALKTATKKEVGAAAGVAEEALRRVDKIIQESTPKIVELDRKIDALRTVVDKIEEASREADGVIRRETGEMIAARFG